MEAITDQVGSSGFLAAPLRFAAKIILPPMNADKASASQAPCLTGQRQHV